MGDPASPGGLPLVYGGCAWPPAAGRTGVRWYCGPWNHSADQTAAPCEPGRRSGGGGETKGAKTGHEGPARPKWEKSLWCNAYPDGAHALQEAVQAQFPEANVLTVDIGPHWSLYWSRYAGADLLGNHTLTNAACEQPNERTPFCGETSSRFHHEGAQ